MKTLAGKKLVGSKEQDMKGTIAEIKGRRT